ncbi:addiction module antidote protein, HigA family [Candidatus Peregrinibacteria bacterium RIFCSPLOWO2_02_FULL_48_14]|nr:MAG: addiction module antidote protein, HigA family [Candidatus Peregrinibacteria bacterium RIFCSPLOWO2_01_FULL_48_20]OGJ44610.1 MAG: addiction module antidote protein, HigA family [Candidatus Peregrinibacteria bacterium RIFCSPLOWO2_02_FULL_48_14]
MNMKTLKPIHPGEILAEEFLKPLEITQYKLAKEINVPAIRISEIIHGKRSITVDTALRLAKFFNTSAEFWVNLQSHYDLEVEEEIFDKTISKEIKTFKYAF